MRAGGEQIRKPRHSDDPSAISGSMPTALLICATLALCVVRPISASAKEHRSTLVRHEFQLTHPGPSTGVTTGRCPGYVKDYIVPPACGGPDAVSNMQWLTIRDAQAYSYCEALRSGCRHFHAELWPNNATRLSRIDWLWSAKRACVWVTGGGPPPGQSGEPTHAHLHYWQ